jgi:hypothetical protein
MNFLNLNQIGQLCPSAITQNHSQHLSDVYKFIPTTDVITAMEEMGWLPTQAIQVKTRKNMMEKNPFKKHMIRFRNPENENLSREIGDTFPEIVLTNSHDGSSSFKFHVGLFRLVCSNGLVIADKTFDEFKLLHKGFQKEQVLEVVSKTSEKIPFVVGKVQDMMIKELTLQQQKEFAKTTSELRWGVDKLVQWEDLLEVNRKEDEGTDLWTVFNRVQENMMNGGTLFITNKDNGRKRTSRSRSIRSIQQNIEVNKMLWEVSESFI